jgi:hypothetical protein
MCATATSARRWKHLFLGLEMFIVFAVLYGIALKVTWCYDVGEHPQIMAVYDHLMGILKPMIWSFLAVMCFLLFVSPFFLRSLRSSALKAWLTGAAGLLYLVGIIFGWWLR